MKRIPIWRSISFSIAVFILISVISKNVLIKIISKFNLLIFAFFALEVLFFITPLQARPSVGVLSVSVSYPSRGMDWLGVFIQEELSLQLQLSDRFSIISPKVMTRWNKRLKNSGKLDSNSIDLKKTEISILKPDKILKLSVQKVLNKLSVNWEIINFQQKEPLLKIKKIHSWESPDKLIESLLNDLANRDKIFSDINHFPFNYSWEGIRSFYEWRQKPLPKVNSIAWKENKIEMEALLLSYPEMSSSIKFCRAIISILESSYTNPVHFPSLNSAENDIVTAMKSQPRNGDHHILLSLVHFLRKEPLFAKQQANISSKINQSNGLSLILYGLTIGKVAFEGENYIRRGLRLYPFIGESFSDGWQPYHILVKELEPWLISKSFEEKNNYEELINSGNQFYNARIWNKATKAFEDASYLKPSLPEPHLYLAKIKLAKQDLKSGLAMIKKLRKKFPKHVDIALYLGYAYEKLKHHLKAEALYREVLRKRPENHKALLRLGAVLIKLGKLEDARSFLENLTKKYPAYTVAWWNLGIAYYQLGEMDLAELAWEESLRLEPENSQVRVILEQLREDLSSYRIQNL